MADYKNIVSHTLYHEGGKSKDKRDNASKNPVPDGTGYHTNKGVTWSTFVALAPKIGYTATASLFYTMPTEIWLKIYKQGYWDKVGADGIKSQGVANMIAQRAWGSGSSRSNKLVQQLLNEVGYKVAVTGVTNPSTIAAINAATNTKAKETTFIKKLYAKNMAYLKSLDDWETYKNGWTTRWDSLLSDSLSLVEKNPIKTAFFFSDSDNSNNLS